MPIYTIEGPDKRTYEIEGPEGASEKDLIATAQRYMQQEDQAAKKTQREAEIADLRRQAEEAALQAAKPTPEGGFKAAAKAGKEQLIADLARVAGRTGIMDVSRAEEIAAEREKTAAETFQGTEDGWLESPWQKFKETLGGSLAYMAAPIAAGAVAGAAPVAGALGVGAGLAAGTAAGLASLAQFTGSNLSRQVQEKGVSLADTDVLAAGAAAVPQALLDVVSLRMLPGINKIFRSAGKELTEDQLKAIAQRNLLTNVGLRGGKVAGAEGLTEVGQQFLERLQADISTTDESARDEYLESLIGGAVLGGTFGGVSGVGAKGRAQRELDARAAKRAAEEEAAGTTPQYTAQGEMFPTELQQAQETVAGIQGPAAPEVTTPEAPAAPTTARQGELDLGGQDLFGAAPEQPAPIAPENMQLPGVTPDTEPSTAAPAGQGTLPLVGGRTENQQIVEMYVADQNAQAVANAQAKQAERVAQGEAGARAAQQERLKFESDLAETDARIKSTQERTTENDRLGLLLPLIENPAVKNIPKAFGNALQSAGFTDTQFTPRERELIQRAYDVRATPEATVQDTVPNEMDVYKEARQQEPQQIGLPGFAAPKGMKAAAPAVEEQVAERPGQGLIQQEQVDYLYLPANSAVRNNIIGKDIFDPAQRAYVKDQLVAARDAFAARTDPRSRTVVKRINDILSSSPFIKEQGELFGPRGGVAKFESVLPQGAQNVNQRTAAEPTAQPGTSQPSVGVGRPSVPKGPAATPSTARVSEPAGGRLADTGRGAKPSPAGKAAAPAPVKKPEVKKPAAPKAEAKPAAPKAPVDPFASLVAQAQAAIDAAPKTETKTEAAKAESEFSKAAREGLNWTSAPAAKPKRKKLMLELRRGFDNLMNWFEGSAVVNANNQPLVMYTGTSKDKDFVKFNIPRNGAWFTSDPAAASMYAVDNDSKGLKYDADKHKYVEVNTASRVMPVYLSIKNPYVMTKADFDAINKENYKRAQGQFFDTLRQKGYDGVDMGSGTWVVLGTPSQIKSALGNNGTFSPTEANILKLTPEETLTSPLPNLVIENLQAGNLTEALGALAQQQSGIMRRITQLLAKALTGTKVKVVQNLKDDSGKRVSGMFDPETNTILLDAETGMTPHALMHEATHGAVSHILDNANHPVTKQLQRIFDSVKGKLDTAYGAQNLQEFVAETWGNQEFRNQLASINMDGTNVTALQKFTNVVTNFLRRMFGAEAKPVSSTLSDVDALIESILSPAPDSRIGEALYMASATKMGDRVIDAASRINESLPERGQKFVSQTHKVLGSDLPGWVKNALRGALPLDALIDSAKSIIPMAKRLGELIDLRKGETDTLIDASDATLRRVTDWAKTQSEAKMKAFNNVVYTSTTEQVDPTEPRTKYEKDPEKLKQYDALKPQWDALDASAKRTYIEMRDAYRKLYDKIGEILKSRVNEEFSGDQTKAKAVNEALRRIMDNAGVIAPYFPLTRMGDFWISYRALNPRTNTTELYVEAFETPMARREYVRELEKSGVKGIEEFAKPTRRTYRNAPSGSFMNQVLQTLELNKVSDTAVDEIMQLFLNSMPESSFAQSFRQRADVKGRLGYQQDAIAAMQSRAPVIINQLMNMKYGAKLGKLNNDIQEYVKENPSDLGREYAEEFNQRIQFAMNPNTPKWAQVTRTLGFNMTLGFNISAALVNMMQLPLVVAPYLGAKYGYSDTTKAIGNATRVFMGSGFTREVTDLNGNKSRIKSAPSIDNYDFSKASAELKHYETLAKLAKERGQTSRSITQDMLDIRGKDTLSEKVNSVSGAAFHHGERMNRQVAMIAAYDLELQRMKSDPKEGKLPQAEREMIAATRAIEVTESLNGGTSAASAPRLAQGGLGSVMFMYKRYGASMYYMMFKTAREAMKGGTPEERSLAMRQIAGIFGSSALLAGVRGLPMFGVAALVYDSLKDDDEDDFRTEVRKWVGEEAYSGGLNAMTGLAISSRVGLSDLIFRDGNTNPDRTVIDSWIEMLGGPALGVANRIQRGIKLLNEGESGRALEQMAPAAAGNVLKGIRFATEGANTLRGDPIVGEVSAWNAGAQMLGFAPADYMMQNEQNAALKGFERAVVQQSSKLLKKYYLAASTGDAEGMSEVLQKIGEFNAKHPTIAITADSIRSSMRKHMQTTAASYGGVAYNKRLMPEILQSMREFNGD